MTLRERLHSEMTDAMRAHDALRRDVLRMAEAAVYSVEKKEHRELSDDEVVAVLAREVKTRRESIEAFRSGGRDDLAEKEEAEIAILAVFLPQQLTDDEVRAIVDEAIVATGAASVKDLGRVMGGRLAEDPRARRREARQRDRRPVSRRAGARGARRRRSLRPARVLAWTHGAAGRFSRRDALRLSLFAFALVALADGDPRRRPARRLGLDLAAGDTAPATVRAPRAVTFASEIATEAKRDEAARAVEPMYDYAEANAAAISEAQVAAFRREARIVDAAFALDDPFARRTALASAFPELSTDSRATLLGLDAIRWATIRDEAASVLGARERTEIRDTEVVEERSGLPMRFPLAWTSGERQLAAELVAPFIVPDLVLLEPRSRRRPGRTRVRRSSPSRSRSPQNAVVVEAGATVTPRGRGEAARARPRHARHRPRPRSPAGSSSRRCSSSSCSRGSGGSAASSGTGTTPCSSSASSSSSPSSRSSSPPAGRSSRTSSRSPRWGSSSRSSWAPDPRWPSRPRSPSSRARPTGAPSSSTTYFLLGGIAGIIAIRRGDRLQVFVQAGLAVAVVNAAVITVFSLLGERDLTGTAQLFAAALASGAGSAIASAGVFAVLGDIFGIPTVFQLQELSNPTRPLLRRLLTEAPGTYHHSLMVGNLAERAAEAIGADPILARVAAYYHDIGKLANPAAFIENQAGGGNLHDDLDPETSARILRAHVADGIDIAYKGKLPKALIAFIPQHHGTAKMSYFLEKARDEAAAPFGGRGTTAGAAAAAEVPEAAFRHQGPKPQSREAAILMLADSVEASVRSLSMHDEAAIRAMVSRIISERLEDGQFDECDLTLRDVERIREAFVSQLLGAYHQRIAYPQNKVVELEARRGSGTGA